MQRNGKFAFFCTGTAGKCRIAQIGVDLGPELPANTAGNQIFVIDVSRDHDRTVRDPVGNKFCRALFDSGNMPDLRSYHPLPGV